MKTLKYLSYLLACIISLSFISCTDSASEEEIPPTPPPVEKEYKSLFSDSKYENGFKVGSVIEGNGQLHGYLDYNQSVGGNPVWLVAQWNCLNNDILDAAYTNEGTKHEYRTEGGNYVITNTAAGTIVLGLNTESEYGKNGITSQPRVYGEPWPTLLIEYSLNENEILKVSDKEEIRMAIDYKVLSLEDKMPAGTTNPDLHSAQFQWFVTVQNRNTSSADFGRYIWFGLNFYDKRYDFAPFFAAEDGGKEQNTGAFIYMPAMQNILGTQGKTEIGKQMEVNIDVLPIIREAFALAQQRNYLTNTTWEELYIGASNIGWEVTGTYNVAVQIDSVNINYLEIQDEN